MKHIVTPTSLDTFLTRLDTAFSRPGALYLIGDTSLVHEGWRRWAETIEFSADIAAQDRAAFDLAMQKVVTETGLSVWEESPGDLIPLPEGFAERHRPTNQPDLQHLQLYHFDPYSVAYRFIARGDEPDYHLVLTFLDQGWVTIDEMDTRITALLPRFSMQTIQQDPAEFRRKYKGLKQMAQTLRPGLIHRPTPA